MADKMAFKYKYNSLSRACIGRKELQDELGLNWYDYQARNYDPAIGRWFNPDPLAGMSRRYSPYTYALDNPVFFIDPDGMLAEEFDNDDPIYNNKAKRIGDDGKNDGKIHIVYNNTQAEDIENQTNAGNAAIDLTGKDVVTLNGGKATVNGVIASVKAQEKDTDRYPTSSDAKKHEEGGHTERDANGNVTIVAWKPGPKINNKGEGEITLFNGVSVPKTTELADYWHVHAAKTIEVDLGNGETKKFRSSMKPSGAPGQKGGDIGGAQILENHGYNATAIQVGLSDGRKIVNFYNSKGLITSMSLRRFKKLKND